MRKLQGVLFFAGLFALLLYLMPRDASAIGGATNDTYIVQSFTPVNGSLGTTAGNIYTFNMTTQDKSYRWVGLWGNVTGSIRLRTATSTFYSWPISTVTTGSIVYATTDPTGVDPTNFVLTNGTYLNQADTAYGYLTTVSDSITNTYTSFKTFQSPSMQTGIVTNITTVDAWDNFMIRKTTGNIATTNDIVWAANVSQGQTAFNSELADYELLIPENEEVGDGEGVVTTYYLWIELN